MRQMHICNASVTENNFPSFFFFFFFYKFYLFYFWLCWVLVAAHGLFSGCGERGLLFVAVCGLLVVVTSLVMEHRL